MKDNNLKISKSRCSGRKEHVGNLQSVNWPRDPEGVGGDLSFWRDCPRDRVEMSELLRYVRGGRSHQKKAGKRNP